SPVRPAPATTGAASAPAQAQFAEGFALHQQGRLAEAQQRYRRVLELQPRHAHALHLSGLIARQTNDPLRAIELIDQALEIEPGNAPAHVNRGNALKDLKRLGEALASYER